jgi:glycine dehydrogenase subunit 2
MIKKVRTHVNQNEALVFERSSPGKRGYQLPPLDVPAVDPATVLGAQNTRDEIADFPEVSEVEAIRHSRASPRTITPSTSASTRSAPAL